MKTSPEDQQNTHQDHLALPANTGKMEASDPNELELMSDPWEIMIKLLDLNTLLSPKGLPDNPLDHSIQGEL